MKIELENAVVYQGSNLDVLPTLPDNSVDSIVTDPPYELGFMGKSWDNSGIAYSVELWTECMRVLKPGGHLLAFGGSRTWHRLAVAIEDAGFEMRDSIAWLYGSGFPKSMDISKQIDKRGGQGAGLSKQIGEALREAREKRGISKSQADQLFCDGTTNWTWFEGRPTGQRPPTPQTFARIVAEWPELQSLANLVAEAEREVIGKNKKADLKDSVYFGNLEAAQKSGRAIGYGEFDITAPATDEAKQWQGWGTALKPAFEPVVVARKPLEEKTVAANVLKYGTGGLNIDGSRIGRAEGDNSSAGNRTATFGTQETESGGDGSGGWEQNSGGRWPANIILDPYTAELLDEQSGVLTSGGGNKSNKQPKAMGSQVPANPNAGDFKVDKGGASRFFYVAKASKKDRNEGLDDLEAVHSGSYTGNASSTTGNKIGANPDRPNQARQNIHPTVKPTTLMKYLIKLVTPPNGTVLDPFTGSGSTGKAALLSGFKFIGIELTEEYLPIIEGRLKWASEQVSKETSEVLF